MSFEVKTTPHFEREAKILAKRYKSFKADMKDFVESLEKNPMQGDELSPGIRKIRLAIVSKGKGKSGGARVITYTICASESEGRVYDNTCSPRLTLSLRNNGKSYFTDTRA